jgi:hypothetical protein
LGFISEYKSSLKAVEVEEILDLVLFRPLAFIFVKATFSFNIKPDQVSVVAMIFGSTAGVLFGFGSFTLVITGAVLYFLSNVLDCADGQIARLKHNGTKVGRIVDGFIDYIVSTFVFLGIAFGLVNQFSQGNINLWGNSFLQINPYIYIWLLSIAGGISSAMQAFYFDFYRNKFLEVAFGKASGILDEINEFTEEKRKFTEDPKYANFMEKILINVYLWYSRLQLNIQKDHENNKNKPDAKEYYRKNKLLLRLWSFMGSTTHITLCVIFGFMNNLEAFLIFCILPLNLLMLSLYFIQRIVNNNLTAPK